MESSTGSRREARFEIQGSRFTALGYLKSIKKVIGIRDEFRDRNLDDMLVQKWSMFEAGGTVWRPAGPGGMGRRPRRRPWNQKERDHSATDLDTRLLRGRAADSETAAPLPPAPLEALKNRRNRSVARGLPQIFTNLIFFETIAIYLFFRVPFEKSILQR